MRQLDFYTDGAYSSKTEMGGWASICIEDGILIDTQCGFEPYSSNNRCELFAVLSALENANTIETKNTKVTIYTDSAYVANTFNQKWYVTWLQNGWKTADKQDVKNQDILCRIVTLYIKLKDKLQLEFIKVKAHNGDHWNEYADHLAVVQRQRLEI